MPNTDRFEKLPKPALGEPYLLTPGPLTTAYEVKQEMLKDWGSWDDDFRTMTAQIRTGLLALIGPKADLYDCVPMQGPGSYAVEAMLGSFVPQDGKVLVLANGAYGMRAAATLEYLGRDKVVLDKGDYMPPRGAEVAEILAKDPAITHVMAIHCETSSGILNPIEEIAEATRGAGRKLLIDSMSAFGALALHPAQLGCAAFVSSANKCIEGVPGFSFVIAQTRFTPPTHVVAAFLKALAAHAAEGGVEARGARYTQNRDIMVSGMRALGFETLLEERWLSPIIVTFFCPADPAFKFSQFYDAMKERGFIIYPGKLTIVDSFRIGCIGQIDTDVMHQLLTAVKAALAQMGVADARMKKAIE